MFEAACREDGRHKVSSKDFKMIRQLGSGAYAKVALATHMKTKLKCALKMYPKSKVDKGIRRKAVQ
jgi:serine/threonine protein kinase